MHYMESMSSKPLSGYSPPACSFLLPRRFRTRHPIVPVVRLERRDRGRDAACARVSPSSSVAPMLERAFSVPQRQGRGARHQFARAARPAQSHLIFRRIRSLAEEKKLPVFAFVEDAAASGGYMIACAARRDLRRSRFDRRIDRRRLGGLRLRPLDRAFRHRAAGAHRRRQQGDARSLPARRTRRTWSG